MKYCSTRGKVRDVRFIEAIHQGYASDGGLFLPQTIPRLSSEQLEEWAGLKYTDVLKKVLPLFITEEDIPFNELCSLIDRSFKSFTQHNGEILPIVNPTGDNAHFMEMFLGPTGAFKDLALGILGNLLDFTSKKDQRHMTIVVGTSGDTGSSAICAVKGSKWIDICVLYPKNGRISSIQEKQINTHTESNVHVFAVDGTSDDLDRPTLNVLNDTAYVKRHNISSINSINLARILIQSVAFIYGYLSLKKKNGASEVTFAIPTGAGGNLTGGILAQRMGLPIKFLVSVNRNDIIHSTMTSGVFQSTTETTATIAPSMDIQVPYNWERVMYLISNGKAVGLAEDMETFKNTGAVKMTEEFVRIHHQIKSNAQMKQAREIITTKSISEEEIRETIRYFYKKDGYLIDPHTAVAAAAFTQLKETPNFSQSHFIIMCTATPAKFYENVETIIGEKIHLPQSYKELQSLPPRVTHMEVGMDWEQMLRQRIEQISQSSQK